MLSYWIIFWLKYIVIFYLAGCFLAAIAAFIRLGPPRNLYGLFMMVNYSWLDLWIIVQPSRAELDALIKHVEEKMKQEGE